MHVAYLSTEFMFTMFICTYHDSKLNFYLLKTFFLPKISCLQFPQLARIQTKDYSLHLKPNCDSINSFKFINFFTKIYLQNIIYKYRFKHFINRKSIKYSLQTLYNFSGLLLTEWGQTLIHPDIGLSYWSTWHTLE